MEPIFQAHPIPQNVTNFEFHLVGDMTLKQFGYLAAGVGFAFLIFTTLSTVQPIIAWPIIVISALLGVAFAFLPIQERPLDHWVAAFFKAIFQPTSLKFSSRIINSADPLFNRRLGHYIKTYQYAQAKQHAVLGNPNLFPTAMAPAVAAGQPKAPPPAPAKTQKKQNFIDKFKAGQTSFGSPEPAQPAVKTQPQPAPPAPPVSGGSMLNSALNLTPPPLAPAAPTVSRLPDLGLSGPASSPQKEPAPKPVAIEAEKKSSGPPEPEDLKKTVELAKEAQETQQEIVKLEASLSQIKQQAAQPGVNPKTYVEDFEDLLTQLQKLNEKASETAQELAKVSKTEAQPESIEVTQNKAAAPIKAKSIPTLKLTSFPNVINGIVTDSLGNYIEGAIVVAHDRQGLPVRALKSNKLGQFVAATPLPNGEYTIMVEKDNLLFDKIGIDLKNEVLPPMLVAAKKMTAAS
ncbi:hypothetical protein A3J44_03930 [candidate division WOR-1 bacterium RIFCSPHIGHO2_02_FULL_45_12]|nr:MAG: hypothetical protein A3J44_03930 [candidate division WOR-1 bacterium RIFCSPHIGHO2_02_FULL_45_12]